MKIGTKVGVLSSTVILVYMAMIGVGAAYTNIEQQQKQVIDKQIECLAKNIYFESRDQSDLGQRAVAWVTLNRVDSAKFPSTICDVVWQDSQFSWTRDGKSDTPKNKQAWDKSVQVALSVYYRYNNKQQFADPTDGAIMFHATYVKPYWRKHFERTVRIDNHIFYRSS